MRIITRETLAAGGSNHAATFLPFILPSSNLHYRFCHGSACLQLYYRAFPTMYVVFLYRLVDNRTTHLIHRHYAVRTWWQTSLPVTILTVLPLFYMLHWRRMYTACCLLPHPTLPPAFPFAHAAAQHARAPHWQPFACLAAAFTNAAVPILPRAHYTLPRPPLAWRSPRAAPRLPRAAVYAHTPAYTTTRCHLRARLFLPRHPTPHHTKPPR